MVDLESLLEEATLADGSTRILLRDDIAAHGIEAIQPMAAWLTDARLGPFAVRVLQRIGADSAIRNAIVSALASANRTRLTPEVRRDVDAAVASLRPATTRAPLPGGKPSRVARPTRHDGSTSEERFHNAMLEIYWLAGHATGYWASYFLRAVRAKGGLEAARDLLRKTGTSPGYERLKVEGHLDFSMEALVIDPEFSSLFTHTEIAIARRRLREAGYNVA